MDKLNASSGATGSAPVSLMEDNCGHAIALYLHVGMSEFSMGAAVVFQHELVMGQVHSHAAPIQDDFLRQSIDGLALVHV